MYRISKGDLTVTADTEAELRIALVVLAEPDAEPAVFHAEASGYREVVGHYEPSWRVGGPSEHNPIPYPYPVAETMVADRSWIEFDHGLTKPKLEVVPTESPDSVTESATVQHITVSRKNLEILEAIMLFGEGVSTGSLSTLLGLSKKAVSGRVQDLKVAGLVRRVNAHWLWEATQLARRSKLVAG